MREARTRRGASSWAGPPATLWPPSGMHVHTERWRGTLTHRQNDHNVPRQHYSVELDVYHATAKSPNPQAGLRFLVVKALLSKRREAGGDNGRC